MTEENRTLPTEQTDGEVGRLTSLLKDAPAPLPCTDGELAAADFSRRNVLIGTVRSDTQFDYCMATGTYYVPVKTLTPANLPVSVIALYEEGLHRKAGIKRCGRVTETRVVKRSDIPVPMSRANPDEAYYLFSVEKWDYLPHPIALQGTSRGKPMLTSEFLLTHCRRSYQLVAISSPETYNLCRLLCTLAETDTNTPVFRRVGERHIITLSEGHVRLLTAAGDCLCACPAEMLTNAPAELLQRMAAGLGLPTR